MSNDEKQQVYAFNLATAGHNFLISGQAGTGKTTLLVKLHDKMREIGKQVAVVCTTGIACASLPSRCDARTVHCWAGMDDGRYDTSYIKDIIINYKKDVYRNILSTDVLILDEVSMLSKKLFEQLECICSLKCGHKLFGGMQLVFCGDFYQLPPVKNRMYNDDGKFCFESELFDQVFPHRITLENVVRQSDSSFIKCVNEAAKGKLSESSVTLLESLKRPLCKDDNDEPINKLYATNEQVDNHNRLRILNKSGQLYEYKAIDRGESHYLKKVLAPPTLWLKDGCPVILVRNISSNLVNGLQGIVLSCKECPVVHFPTVDITTKLEKQTFSVFSPVLKKNVAERTQVPLKLAYALTVHKAQGMTLQRAEIDCHSMFAPGQLGVAIGRVKSPAGLRVINFKREICLPQPPIIEDAMKFCSAPDIDDCSCCRITRKVNMVPIPVPCTSLSYESHIQDEFEEEEEEEINLVTPDSDVSSVDALSIPEGFDVVNVIRDLKVGNAMTKLQEESNNAVEELLTNHIDVVNTFCSEEFECIQGMMEEQSLNIDDADPQPVHADKISRFYKLCHQHQTSSEFKARSYLMFFDLRETSQQIIAHISFNISCAIRKYLLQQKANLYRTAGSSKGQRQTTEASHGKIRYVGGYCIAKARLKHRKRLTNYCFKLGDSEQLQYNEAKCMLKIIDTLAVNESILQTSTQYPESLIETAFRQYQTRGLTNITDKVFQFFISTCDKCLHLLVDENLNIHGQNLFEKCNASISKDMDLFKVFLTSIPTITQDDFMKDDSVVGLLGEMVMISSCSELLFQELSEKYLLVMVNQYRKDFLMNLSVQKKMAHRKQIQVGSQSKGNVKKAGLKLNFDFILADSSTEKSCSHNLLKGLVHQDENYLSSMKKNHLICLCKAYDCKVKTSDNKAAIIKVLNQSLKQATVMPHPEYLYEDQSCVQPNVTIEANEEGGSGQTSEDSCIVCKKAEGHIDWIQCEKCEKWLHRDCAGLKTKRKWVSATSSTFCCKKCK